MKARILLGLLILLALVSFILVSAPEVAEVASPEQLTVSIDTETLEALTATSVLIERASVRDVLFERTSDTVRPIASVAKLFTAHIVHTSASLNNETTILRSDLLTEGQSGSLMYGDVYTLRELLFPLLLVSSNDAATVLVRSIGAETYRTAFGELKTTIGLSHTNIEDASGLSDKNVSTARDLATFIDYLSVHDRHILDITRLRSYVGEEHAWANNNPAREHPEFIGGKHGFTDAAGRTFAGQFEKNGHVYTVILLESSDLASDISLILSALQ